MDSVNGDGRINVIFCRIPDSNILRLKFVGIQVFGTICRIIVLSTGQLETVPVTLGTNIHHVSGHC